MLSSLGGRKFILSLVGMLCITLLAIEGADAASFGSIALIVGAFSGANGWVESAYAKKASNGE